VSMSTQVIGLIKQDEEKYQQMYKVYQACIDADIELPDTVIGFFNLDEYDEPDPGGVRIDISAAVEEWSDESSMGYQVVVAKLPKDVTVIRFYNSW